MSVSPELWERVYERDERRCIAPRLDPGCGPCRDKWGEPIKKASTRAYPRQTLTFAHIKTDPGGARRDHEAFGVMACWGHHVAGRGEGSMWITRDDALELVRDYLEERYPVEWALALAGKWAEESA
jgi:hypothetical protein